MPHARLSGEEIERRGEALYEQQIRQDVETDENIGKILSIDVETGDYELGDDLIVTCRHLFDRHPGAAIWTKRAGYSAVYSLGGARKRTT
jgi:hypothetical protein